MCRSGKSVYNMGIIDTNNMLHIALFTVQEERLKELRHDVLASIVPLGASDESSADAEEIEKQLRKFPEHYLTLTPPARIAADLDVIRELDPDEMQKPRDSVSQATSEQYLLQAGSFRQREDADRRRAELLLLGLEPQVEEATGDNGRWYRVYLGPYSSRSEMSRARSLTAGQDIDTLLLKRGTP